MPLSRLENFLKNAEGNILYVNPSDFDATDSFENQGNSLTRPFKSIQRALIEAARFSFQSGKNNDRIDRTTILVYPGTHYIDNRPGFSIEKNGSSALYKRRVSPTEWAVDTISEFGDNTNYDILNDNNDLYKFNSVNGGVILPRGTSIIGLDLRKTKIRPLYVPDPYDDSVENSSILNVTGTCYFTAFTIFDGDLTKTVFNNYSGQKVVPNFSHHKLVTFAYADGVNKVKLGTYQTDLTDLDMYYYKITKAYGEITKRELQDYPTSTDFEPNVDEFRIVGSLDANPLGISSIRAGNGDGTGDLNLITVTTSSILTGDATPHNLFVDSPFIISGVTQDAASYNGSYTVKDIVGITTFTYVTSQQPTEYLPSSDKFETASLTVATDTVSSASPYIFNCSLRSVYGLNGLWADGDKASGFKSMVVAQFTGVSLQKDNNAFIVYENGIFYDNTTLSENSQQRPLHTNSRAKYKPDWESFHIRASNGAFIQNVSVFAIGFAKHFLTETGGDMSITNSNSNFGAISLESTGYRAESFDRDDVGYITHIIPPKEIASEETVISWLSIDVDLTINSNDNKKLYIYSATNEEILPSFQVDGFRIGAKDNDRLYIDVNVGAQIINYNSPIYMQVPSGTEGVSGKKVARVQRQNNVNSTDNSLFTLTDNHKFINGEKVRLYSDTGENPSGLSNDAIYYVITSGLGANQIKLAQSLNDAISETALLGIGNNGGVLTIESRVNDKVPGEIGHPIQFDKTVNNWYILGPNNLTSTDIRSGINAQGIEVIGTETSAAYYIRTPDTRSIDDKIYKIRYVIPKEFTNARQPEAGFILQESKTVGVSDNSFTNETITNTKDLRNERVIVNATHSSTVNGKQIVTITTEKPHNFIIGDTVNVKNIISTNNPTSVGITSTYNGIYPITQVLNSKQFQYDISGVKLSPGTFSNSINLRITKQQRESLPLVSRKDYKNTFFIYRSSQIKKHIPGVDGQDGVYHLIAIASNVSPSSNVGFNLDKKSFNQDVKNLYPQLDRDNINSDPNPSESFADLEVIGNVITNKKTNSITKESLSYFLKNTNLGLSISSLSLSGIGNSQITIVTDREHNLNNITNFSFTSGSGYSPSSVLYAVQLNTLTGNGSGATAKVTTNSSGQVTGVELIDSGSSFNVGNTLSIPGGSTLSIITVTAIGSYVGSSLELCNFSNSELNSSFEVTSVTDSKTIVLSAPLGISTYTPNTSGSTHFALKSHYSLNINSIQFNPSVGVATISCNKSHGLYPGNKINITNTGISTFNTEHIVKDIIGISTFTISINSSIPLSSSSGKIAKKALSSNGRNIGSGEENLPSRGLYFYDGYSTTINQTFDQNSNTISFSNSSGIKRGDYYIVNSEIIRILSSSNPFTVKRGAFGTFKTTAVAETIIKKIKVIPSEIRRPSFMRASGHTFEYLGYGPGNYSTGMPQKQDRVLSEIEVIVSQSRKQKGGTVVYNGMNDLGETFTGSKKISSATGEETIFDSPLLTYTGDDAQGQVETVSNGLFDEVLVRQRLTVEGGDNNNQTSQFFGPVNFTQKVTNLSQYGIESKYLLLKGDAPQSKTITVGISTPTSALIPSPRSGDVSFVSNPVDNYFGHVRLNNEWRKFGLVSLKENTLEFKVDKLYIDSDSDNTFNFVADGNSKVQNLLITGDVVFTQPQTLNDVTFENTIIKGTAKFLGTGIDPVTGLTTNYTQIHLTGTSKLNNLEVVGISTFSEKVDFNKNIYGIGADFGNIQIGITDDNTIDTQTGNLTINSAGGTVNITDDVLVRGSQIRLTSVSGFVTSILADSKDLTIGIGVDTVNSGSTINLHNDSVQYPSGGLRIIRSAGTGSNTSESEILHRGSTKLKLRAQDAGSSISLMTDDTERILVGSSGTVTTFQNNSGQNLAGAHLKINQSGSGDVVLSWDITHNNANRRWYAGIDVSDSYSWKLANPSTITAYGTENFDTTNETKLKVTPDGDLDILRNLTIRGTTVATPTTGTFTLLNTNATTINAFGAATAITFGSNANTASIILNGTTQATNTTTGALQVRGGVGLSGNLHVGNSATVGGSISVNDTATIAKQLKVNDNTQSTSISTGSLVLSGGAGIAGNVYIGNALDVAQGTTLRGTFVAKETSTFEKLLTAQSTSALNAVTVSGITTFSNTTDITPATAGCNTGAIRVAGGMSIAGSLKVCGTVYNNNQEVIGECSERVKTITRSTNSDHYITFVDSDNSTSGKEYVYTDAGIYYNPSTNKLSITGDITAFAGAASDDKLKTNRNIIPNALGKVVSLTGFTFNWNETAIKLGLDSPANQVGLSAQQVNEVLPEAVRSEVLNGEDILIVKYEKVVPLLVEAIKELKKEIDLLKEEIKNGSK